MCLDQRLIPLALLFFALLAPVAQARATDVASTCADYPNQAAAQRAADTRDADGDGIYCEALPCPCLKSAEKPKRSGCTKPSGVQPISFSKTKFPNIEHHTEQAIRKGWPEVLVLNRDGADARRDRLMAARQTRAGYDRDEYPPAVGRRRWQADVAFVPSAENRRHGSTLGTKLRRFCDGTKFKYVFY